jgi:hypothetical protein
VISQFSRFNQLSKRCIVSVGTSAGKSACIASPIRPVKVRLLQVPGAVSKLALSKYRAVEPDHLVLRPRKMRSGQRFSYLALGSRRNPRAGTPLTTSAFTATNPISSR